MGLAAPHWEVRNSATLCYTALLTRILGFANLSSTGLAARRAPAAAEFFAAYPRLQPFLLKQLTAAAEQLTAGHTDLHPSLCPVLALLMRFRPSSAGATARGIEAGPGAFRPEAFIPLVQLCGGARQMAVRTLASRALAPLVPFEDLVTTTRSLAEAAVSELTSEGGPQGSKTSFNRVHGHLLQLSALLRMLVNAENEEQETVVAVIAGVTPVLQPCLHVCQPGIYPCAPISAEVLHIATCIAQLGAACRSQQACDFVAGVAAAAWSSVLQADQLWTTSSQGTGDGSYLENELLLPSAAVHAAAPMLSVAFKHAVRVRLLAWPRCHYAVHAALPAGWDYVSELAQILASPSYEIRCEGLRCGLRALPEAGLVPEADFPAMCAVLALHAEREMHPKAQRRTLQLLAAVLAQGGLTGSCVDAGNLFGVIAKHAEHAADPAIKAAAVRCLGALLPARLGARCEDGGRDVGSKVKILTDVIQECSSPAEVETLREAAVDALATSDLLTLGKSNANDLLEASVAAWACLVNLLEDEDPEIRGAAAVVAANAIEHLEALYPVSERGITTRNGSLKDCWVEKVLRGTLPALSLAFGGSLPLTKQLQSWTCSVREDAHAAEVLLQECAPRVASNGTSVGEETGVTVDGTVLGRLFDSEAANQNEEPLLLAQLAARELAKGQASAGAEQLECMREWGDRAARALLALVKLPAWGVLGGYASSSQVETLFLPVYRLWLAVWVSGRVLSGKPEAASLLEVVVELAAELEAGQWRGLSRCLHLRSIASAALRAWGLKEGEEGAALWDAASFILET